MSEKCEYSASIRKGSLESVHGEKMTPAHNFKSSHALL